MRAHILVAALVAGCAFAGQAQAGASVCPPMARPLQVHINPKDGGVIYNTTLSSPQIAQLGGAATLGGVPRGLTTTTFRYELNLQMARATIPGGGVCLQPVGVTIDIGYDPMTVYIENRYPQGGCNYAVVMRHEMTHVQNKREPLARWMPSIEAAARRAAANQAFPVYAPTFDMARDMVMGQVNAEIQPIVNALRAETRSLDQQLDSPSSLRGSQQSCPVW